MSGGGNLRLPEARLHIFKGSRAIAELRRGRRVEWSAANRTEVGEIAFFYHAAPTSGIVAAGRALEDARPDRTWGAIAWFDRALFPSPVFLRELRAEPLAGRWSVWRMLSRTTVRVPPAIVAGIARLLRSRRPPDRVLRWLAPFLDLADGA